MVEIYNIDVTSHERFARDQQEIEAFKQQFHLPTTSTRFFDVQTKVLDFVPKQPAVDLLMQTFMRSSWARFGLPERYHAQRFFSSHVAPSLGSQEKQTADIERVRAFLNKETRERFDKERDERRHREGDAHDEEEELCDEGDALIELLDKGIRETNEMVDFVSARVKQFIQA